MQVQQIQWRQECLEKSRSGIIRLQHDDLFYLFRLTGAVVYYCDLQIRIIYNQKSHYYMIIFHSQIH